MDIRNQEKIILCLASETPYINSIEDNLYQYLFSNYLQIIFVENNKVNHKKKMCNKKEKKIESQTRNKEHLVTLKISPDSNLCPISFLILKGTLMSSYDYNYESNPPQLITSSKQEN